MEASELELEVVGAGVGGVGKGAGDVGNDVGDVGNGVGTVGNGVGDVGKGVGGAVAEGWFWPRQNTVPSPIHSSSTTPIPGPKLTIVSASPGSKKLGQQDRIVHYHKIHRRNQKYIHLTRRQCYRQTAAAAPEQHC